MKKPKKNGLKMQKKEKGACSKEGGKITEGKKERKGRRKNNKNEEKEKEKEKSKRLQR